MSAVHRLFREWLEQYVNDGAGPHWHQDDLEEAFAAGWEALSGARWVTSSVPMLGVEGGEDRGPVIDRCGTKFTTSSPEEIECELARGHEDGHCGSFEW